MSQRYRVFIDGQAGTTGLQIQQRLVNHPQIDMLNIDEAQRKDARARQALMKQADVTILCLPDAAAREAVALADEVGARVLDASSAHRVADGWVYGLAELAADQREKIRAASHVSNPGCYATGAIALLAPLTQAGLLLADRPLAINAVSGYSGGGKQMIEKYQQAGTGYAAYGLGFDHKHLKEIQAWSGLSSRPIFQPAVGDYAQGMLVFIPLNDVDGEPLQQALAQFYAAQPFIKVHELNQLDADSAPYLLPEALNNTNNMELFVFSHAEQRQSILVARLDNLGKGASGAAVQNLNIMLGLNEETCVNL
ncbi:N-acetyl-gamma-glutamyl-phosphate reductase [bacteria symbiont BFo1 of Frankliniella occidentalis]|uniref:N-acetyl-gamma-glutamyl-phosphate reductase n=1 Tax=Erwinia aphidicola TaxID=68334 RepID=A0ABU8DKV3_ERWAP|nr:N-acetyl-gamma-glutamyl-phosphate reductase [Erwinia aphidicola]KMV70280.1 N-acetyl-gamma-glutamyl-phosphate reductase [bacteria symbiont BFo1 of Frankliniella occidentalis]KYP84566.1 N-acetyl-gamma-glutamyl-phosphate reductase [bacteria symbiont BFo1 of Frankliniella occidentalis]KYP89806.1 N-acetyl-gamma-glutamyl-phosphate reductase [bacteria symbiont BFo1 of Frankliniella occidentalis]MBD1377120.1 N-acetyl-gamma-glutamyl-phosphate reductase [Erwinia aphidicola]CAH0270929.1 N-acetyl-gamma